MAGRYRNVSFFKHAFIKNACESNNFCGRQCGRAMPLTVKPIAVFTEIVIAQSDRSDLLKYVIGMSEHNGNKGCHDSSSGIRWEKGKH